jgi:8-oxo-dGTP diphosphatase
MAYTYAYPRPAVTVDAAVFRKTGGNVDILLIQRGGEPFKGGWALPGGFVDMDETLEEAVHRELEEETGLKEIDLRQLHAFSALDRDPRGRTISVVFTGLLKNDQNAKAGDDAADVRWFGVENLPSLAFDHADVITMALLRVRSTFQ